MVHYVLTFLCLCGCGFLRTIVFYIFSLLIIAFATFRLKRGLHATYSTRRSVTRDTFVIVISIVCYSSALSLMYAVYGSNPEGADSAVEKHLRNLIVYFLACRYVTLYWHMYEYGVMWCRFSSSHFKCAVNCCSLFSMRLISSQGLC